MKKTTYILIIFFATITHKFAFCGKKVVTQNNCVISEDSFSQILKNILNNETQEIQQIYRKMDIIDDKYDAIRKAITAFHQSLVTSHMNVIQQGSVAVRDPSFEEKIIDEAQKMDEKLDDALQCLPDRCRLLIKKIDALATVRDTYTQLKKIRYDYCVLEKAADDNCLTPVLIYTQGLVQQGKDFGDPAVYEPIIDYIRIAKLDYFAKIQCIFFAYRHEIGQVITDTSQRIAINLSSALQQLEDERIHEINQICTHPNAVAITIERIRGLRIQNSENLNANLQENMETLTLSNG
jgi:hypothetical protein